MPGWRADLGRVDPRVHDEWARIRRSLSAMGRHLMMRQGNAHSRRRRSSNTFRASAALVLSLALLAQATPAYAHNPFTTLDVRYPGFAARQWSFKSVHIFNGCVEGGDSTPCSSGFDFKVHSGAQIYLSGWQALGTVVKSPTRHWPNSTSVEAIFRFNCPSGHPRYTMRTRGKGGLVHNGVWAWTGFFFSPGRTETC